MQNISALFFLNCFDDFRRWRIFYNMSYDGTESGRSCTPNSKRWRRGVRWRRCYWPPALRISSPLRTDRPCCSSSFRNSSKRSVQCLNSLCTVISVSLQWHLVSVLWYLSLCTVISICSSIHDSLYSNKCYCIQWYPSLCAVISVYVNWYLVY